MAIIKDQKSASETAWGPSYESFIKKKIAHCRALEDGCNHQIVFVVLFFFGEGAPFCRTHTHFAPHQRDAEITLASSGSLDDDGTVLEQCPAFHSQACH